MGGFLCTWSLAGELLDRRAIGVALDSVAEHDGLLALGDRRGGLWIMETLSA
jgi:hypothetical protein